jgi:hypothetical protein
MLEVWSSIRSIIDDGLPEPLDDYIDSVEVQCEYYGLSSLKSGGKLTLHPGAIYLYFKDGILKVLADIDHVYHRCEKGLKDNIRFLYKTFNDLKSIGYDVAIVGKAYDDDLILLTFI